MQGGRAIRVVVLCAVALAGVLCSAGGASADLSQTRSCGWLARLAGDQLNVAYPDQAAQYWIARPVIPPGAHVEIAGRYPHARYISFITYTAASQAIDGIADVNIAPDAGSSNPFVAGADRTAANRSYHVEVSPTAAPSSGREPNTVYFDNGKPATDTSSKSAKGGGLFIYRVYEADRGLDVAGGVGLPSLTLVLADGTRQTLPDCPEDSLPDAGVTQAMAGAGLGPSQVPVSTGLGGTTPPQWLRYINAANSVAAGVSDNERTGATVWPAAQKATAMAPSGGFFENVNNAYVFSFYSSSFGDVLLLHGKAPITPRTLDGEPTMGTGQLRYYSFCTNATTSQYMQCANDDAIKVDANGYYTIAISTGANRPSNATSDCGITWLGAGPTPQSALILRNMLPDPSFAQAIQNVPQGSEQSVMGAYYPVGTYYAHKTDVEKLGCPIA